MNQNLISVVDLRGKHLFKRSSGRVAPRGADELPSSDIDRHLPRPQRHYARCNVGTVSRLNIRVCDLLYNPIIL